MRKTCRRVFAIACVFAGFILLSGAERGWAQTTFQAYTKPQALPDFSLEDLQGKRVHIRDLVGRAIFLNFWATW